MKTVLASILLYFYYDLKALQRQAQYGVQFMLFPVLGTTIFLAGYGAVRMTGGNTSDLFYLFPVYVLVNFPVGTVMQSAHRIFREPTLSGPLLATPAGLNTLFSQFVGNAWMALLGDLIALAFVGILTKPAFHGLSSVAGLLLLFLFAVPGIWLGMAIGMKLVFANELSQFVLVGFFLVFAMPTDRPWIWLTLPFSAAIQLMRGFAMPDAFFCGAVGTLLWWVGGKLLLRYAFDQYRAGKGVDRR